MEKSDSISTGKKLVDRILSYRIFPDEQGKMNLSLKDINGGLLMVPQFTLVAETNKGTRPGFSIGMDHAAGQSLFLDTLAYAKEIYKTVASGEFGASMQVSLCNDGPVTFILSSK